MSSDEDLLALVSNKDEKLFCYCPGCGSAWDTIPTEVNETNTLKRYAPTGARAAVINDLVRNNIENYSKTDLYNNYNEIL